MPTNHKPATALPWVAPFGSVQTPDAKVVALCSRRYKERQTSEVAARGEADAAYIAHAANAYQRLVEALKDVNKLSFQFNQELESAERIGNVARAILRELGEE